MNGRKVAEETKRSEQKGSEPRLCEGVTQSVDPNSVWKEKGRWRIKAVQMNNLRTIIGVRRTHRMGSKRTSWCS